MRKLASVFALAVAALSVADYLGWRADHRRLLSLTTESGIDRWQPAIAAELARETVPARAASLLAWTLLDLEVDRSWLSELPPDQRRAEAGRGLDRLATARRLAEEVLRRQPASWQAATVLGTSRFLEASRRRLQENPTSAWRDPLMAAMRLAPAYHEPPTLLASAYLSRWSSLSANERSQVPALLSRAMRDERGLRVLLPAWVRRAPSLDRMLEPIPDRPGAWEALGAEFLRLGDLERFAMAHRRRLNSLPADLAERAEMGRARLRGGHPRAGTGLLLSVLSAPPDLAYADTLSVVLAALPEGEGRKEQEAWRLWAEDLCAVGRCPLDAAIRSRLGAAEPPAGGHRLSERVTWPRDAWQRRGRAYRLRLNAARPARELRIEMPRLPASGAAFELRWDGRFVGVAALADGEVLVRPLGVAAGAHLLEIARLGERPLRPGAVSLGPA